METMKFFFDKEGDVLDMSIGDPKNAITKEIGHDMLLRIDPKTRNIVGFTILNFEKRFEGTSKPEHLTLPIIGDLKLAA